MQRGKRNFQTAQNGVFHSVAIFAGQLKRNQLYLSAKTWCGVLGSVYDIHIRICTQTHTHTSHTSHTCTEHNPQVHHKDHPCVDPRSHVHKNPCIICAYTYTHVYTYTYAHAGQNQRVCDQDHRCFNVCSGLVCKYLRRILYREDLHNYKSAGRRRTKGQFALLMPVFCVCVCTYSRRIYIYIGKILIVTSAPEGGEQRVCLRFSYPYFVCVYMYVRTYSGCILYRNTLTITRVPEGCEQRVGTYIYTYIRIAHALDADFLVEVVSMLACMHTYVHTRLHTSTHLTRDRLAKKLSRSQTPITHTYIHTCKHT